MQLTYHVVLEKRGFLGGIKRVVVEAEVNERRDARPAASSGAAARAGARGAPSRRPGGGGGGAAAATAIADEAAAARTRSWTDAFRRQAAAVRGAKPRDDFQTGDFERFAGEIPEQGPESEQAGVVRAWCARVLELGEARSSRSAPRRTRRRSSCGCYGRDARAAHRANTASCSTRCRFSATRRWSAAKSKKRSSSNCEEFKERRAERARARRRRSWPTACARNGREQLLPAMTPIERRIVHLALQEDADVTTESRGDGFYKRVAIVMPQRARSSLPSSVARTRNSTRSSLRRRRSAGERWRSFASTVRAAARSCRTLGGVSPERALPPWRN